MAYRPPYHDPDSIYVDGQHISAKKMNPDKIFWLLGAYVTVATIRFKASTVNEAA